jgi:hypothetical protein
VRAERCGRCGAVYREFAGHECSLSGGPRTRPPVIEPGVAAETVVRRARLKAWRKHNRRKLDDVRWRAYWGQGKGEMR